MLVDGLFRVAGENGGVWSCLYGSSGMFQYFRYLLVEIKKRQVRIHSTSRNINCRRGDRCLRDPSR